MHIKGPLSKFTKNVSGQPDILAAIALSLREDYDIEGCMLFKFAEKVTITGNGMQGTKFLGRDDLLVVIQISDFTALCIALIPDTAAGGVLHLFKVPFDLDDLEPEEFHLEGGMRLDPRKIYWERTYELASPDDFDSVLRIITANFEGQNGWPHRRSKRARVC